MKYVVSHLRAYLLENFRIKLYASAAAWAALLFLFNFYFDFEDSYIDSFFGSYIRVVLLFLIHLISYIGTCFFIEKYTDIRFLKNKEFWLVICLGFALLAFDRGQHHIYDFSKSLSDQYYVYRFTYKFLQRWAHVFTLILPLLLFRKLYLKNYDSSLYGLKRNGTVMPYFILLLMMVPLICAASFLPDFLKQYPNYSSAYIPEFSTMTGVNETLAFVSYQISYAIGFINVEIFFRGFLIFAMVRFLGPHAVLPMAVTYGVLHFGKPLGEAISSVFGGYILGVLALRTRNIYGGIIVHIGIAWLMELFAWWQKSR